MIKNKHLYAMAALALAAAFLLGLSGAATLADKSAGKAPEEDRLVGMLLTSEYLDLFDMEAYFKDHAEELFNGGLIDGGGSAYQGRLYARLVEEVYTDEGGREYTSKSYTFEGVCEGIEYFYARIEDESGSGFAAYGNEAVSEGSSSFAYLDEGESVALEGMIYVLPSPGGLTQHFFNPVYQAADGSIYVQSGSSISTDGITNEGEVYSQSLSATYTTVVNGVSKTDSISVKIGVSVMFKPVRVRVVQFDAQNVGLAFDEYAPGALPETICPAPGAQYLIVETFSQSPEGGELVTRALYTPKENMLETYRAREDGVCVKQFAALEWDA